MKMSTKIFFMLLTIPPLIYIVNPFGANSYDPRARVWGFVPYRMPSKSMEPTLQVGDFMLVYVGAYKNKVPEIGDVVIFKYPKDRSTEYVKRVIGRGKDVVSLKNGIVSVNNAVLDQPYVKSENNIRTSKVDGTWEVPDGFLFVLGDNRDNSNDSRYWGLVPNKDLVGKVTMIWMSNSSKRIGKKVE